MKRCRHRLPHCPTHPPLTPCALDCCVLPPPPSSVCCLREILAGSVCPPNSLPHIVLLWIWHKFLRLPPRSGSPPPHCPHFLSSSSSCRPCLSAPPNRGLYSGSRTSKKRIISGEVQFFSFIQFLLKILL